MNTIDKIIALLKKQGKCQKDLTDYLGIGQNQFTDWKSGRIKSYSKHLGKIAEFFGVSVDYLISDMPIDESATIKAELTRQENTLLQSFRKTTDEGRQRMIQSVLNIYDETEKNNRT